MSIILAEAAIDENGQTGYEGSTPGDQTGNEVRNIEYYEYRKGWNHVFRWKDRHLAERFAIRMQGAVKNDKVGYSQPKRYTYWDKLKRSDYDPAKIKYNCECDCSSLVCANVNAALLEAGIKTNISPMEYTASMEKAFLNDKNFTDVVAQVNLKTGDGLMVGDILLSPPQGHTACVYLVNKITIYSKEPKWVAEAVRYCNVYSTTTENALLSSWPNLGQGNRVDVCDETSSRYYVRIAAKYFGFVEKTNLVALNIGKTGTVSTSLWLRSSASSKNDLNKIRTMKTGDEVEILDTVKSDTGSKWYKVKHKGTIGFCSASYVK